MKITHTNRKPHAVVFDLDGVLADNNGRLPHLRSEPPDWVAFYCGVEKDPCIDGWGVLLRMLYDSGYTIIILTGRPERVCEDTVCWMEKHDIHYDHIYMRPDAYTDIKNYKEIILEQIQQQYHVTLAIDDDPDNCAMYKEKGIPVIYVHSGYYEQGRIDEDWQRLS